MKIRIWDTYLSWYFIIQLRVRVFTQAGPEAAVAKYQPWTSQSGGHLASQVLEALILIDEDKRGPTIHEALTLSGVSPKQWSTLECADYLRKNGMIEIKDTGQVVIRKLIDGTPYGPDLVVTRCPPAAAEGYGFGQSQKTFSSTSKVNGVLKGMDADLDLNRR